MNRTFRSRLPVGRTRRRTLIGLVVVAPLLVVAVAQVALPGFARDRLRARLAERVGPVRSLDLEANPAVKLLWGDADRVALHLGAVDTAALNGGGPADKLMKVKDVDVAVDALDAPIATATDVRFRKDGSAFAAGLTVDPDALELGGGNGGRLGTLTAEVGDDGGLVLRSSRLQGLRLRVTTDGGAIVAEPEGNGLLGALIGSATLFEPSRLRFDDLTAAPAGDGGALRLSVHGQVQA